MVLIKKIYMKLATKQKPCKGTGLAIGYGCNTLQLFRKFGLGTKCRCYQNWLLNSDNGKIYMENITIRNHSKLERQSKIDSAKKTKEAKIDLLTNDAYRSIILQPIINEIARLVDYGKPCIATGLFGKMNGGHYISVGSNKTICLNLHNIHIQSFESNHFKSGDTIKYQKGIVATYGQDYLDFMNSLQIHRKIGLKKNELIELTVTAKEIRNELLKDIKVRTSEERINLRNEINLRLNIYEKGFCAFNHF